MFDNIRNTHGEALDYAFHQGDPKSPWIVVLGHGVTANKDRVFLTMLAAGLQDRGIPALRFSFSGNGDSEGRFEDSTISKEVDDLGSVLDQVPDDISVCYVGHSMGGAVGLTRTVDDDRIRALVSLAGMVDTKSFCERKFGDQEPGKSLMWGKSDCPLSQRFVDDMHEIGSLLPRASSVRVPWLLVHGTDDTVVPIADSNNAHAACRHAELVVLEGVDHVFTGAGADEMVSSVVPWIERQLR